MLYLHIDFLMCREDGLFAAAGHKGERERNIVNAFYFADFLVQPFKAGLKPVSYTHLDVYKRQAQDGLRGLGNIVETARDETVFQAVHLISI